MAKMAPNGNAQRLNDLQATGIPSEIFSSSVQMPANRDTGAHELSGEAHKRFVIVTVLLSLIEPVRGQTTVYSLDRHPHDSSRHEDRICKFLDSFALICSTSSSGAETAAAVCLEQGHLDGSVLRLARNRGVPQELVAKLQDILNDLTAFAARERTWPQAEAEILLKVIDLTHDKIMFLLDKIMAPDVNATVAEAISTINSNPDDDSEDASFRNWVSRLPALLSLRSNATLDQLAPHIAWASQAKWRYADQLEALLCPEGEDLPLWVNYIYKIGRYVAATRAMLKLAAKQPDFFTSIRIEAVEAPARVAFSLHNNKTALQSTLRRLAEDGDPNAFMHRLKEFWLTDDPESRLRKACRLNLTVHAEMQLLAFYDHHPDFTPRLLFMGLSKKACYLCHEFMSRHPLGIGVGACHQKLYPTWMPAPCSPTVRRMHKPLLWNLTKHLEETIVRDLKSRLRPNRLPQLDSTAGPSLTTTDSHFSSAFAALEIRRLDQARAAEDIQET